MLITAGADIDAKTNNGNSALTLAAFKGNLECVKALIAAGANVNSMINNGNTALVCARTSPLRNDKNAADFENIIAQLIAAGAQE